MENGSKNICKTSKFKLLKYYMSQAKKNSLQNTCESWIAYYQLKKMLTGNIKGKRPRTKKLKGTKH